MTHINDFPFRTRVDVQWGDMDAAQHVNNVVYLRWSETARIALFEDVFDNGVDFSTGVGPILAWQDCKYIYPLTYPDVALLGVRVTDIQADRFFLEVGVFSDRLNRLAALSKQSIMPYDYRTLSKAELPESWRSGLKRYVTPAQ